jgi:hypothetical protein
MEVDNNSSEFGTDE